MSHLLERLQAAIGAQYEVRGEVASGGMGVVFRGFDPTLRRPVAIKVLKPELATATVAARFGREARILAQLSHPNIVTVHQAGEAGGLFYYVMEYVEGETLADRIGRGPLPADDVLRIAHQLLEGLATAHSAGVIHRDLKPANVLLRPDRAMIGDFGIAQVDRTETDADRTTGNPGTLAYMAPEQRFGSPATVRSDLYSMGMVLFQAATGRMWISGSAPDQSNLSGVPSRLRGALRRALDPAPDRRWGSATAMMRALDRVPRSWIVGGIAVISMVVAGVVLTPPAPPPGALRIYLAPTRSTDPIGDSTEAVLSDRLAGAMDFALLPSRHGTIATVRTTIDADADSIRLSATIDRGRLRASSPVRAGPVPRSRWRAAADSLADRLIRTFYLDSDLNPWLPLEALPRSADGLGAWYIAERAYGLAQWEQAFTLYRQALAIDSTCHLCLYRLDDVERWLSRTAPDRTATLLAHQASFPPHYRDLIRAKSLWGRARSDAFEDVATRTGNFGLAWFALGDELFHRGPLHGRPRADAVEPLTNAVTYQQRFAPGWEHLAWLGLSLGDSGLTRTALDSLARSQSGGERPAALHALLALAGAWLLRPEEEARESTDAVLARPDIFQKTETSAGARVLLTMGSPAGAVYLGERFAERGSRRDLVRNGLFGAFFGATAGGRAALAEEIRGRIRRFEPDPDLDLFLAGWDVVHGLVRPDSTRPDPVAALRTALDQANGAGRDRLGWLVAVFDPKAPAAFEGDAGVLVTAVQAARAGSPERALALTDSLHPLEPGPPPDPFLPLVLRWLRADWLERVGRATAAAWELGGYRHLQLVGLPNGNPQAGEIDWSFGPDQAWRRALLFGETGSTAERCGALAEVVHWWKDATGRPRILADSAVALRDGAGCDR